MNVFHTLARRFPDVIELLIAAGILDFIKDKLGRDNKRRAQFVNNKNSLRVNPRLKRQVI